MKADEVEAGFAGNDAPFMDRFAVSAIHGFREIDPRQAGMVSRTPDHVPDVHHAAVRQQRLAVTDARDASRPRDARGDEVARFHPNQSAAF